MDGRPSISYSSQQNAAASVPVALPVASSDTMSQKETIVIKTTTTPRRRVLTSRTKTGSVTSSASAFTPVVHSTLCQTGQNQQSVGHGGAVKQSTSSSTDLSQSTSSATSLSDDNATNNSTTNSSAPESGRTSLFHAVIRMIALAEGGIIDPNDPEIGFAVNDAMYGILINKTHRLVYTRQFGLRLLQLIDSLN